MNLVSSAPSAALTAPVPKRPMWERDIAELRQEEEDLSLAGAGEPETVASVTQISAQGVPAWLYWPKQYRKGVLVWLHGGAWMLGSPASHDPLARAFANRISCAVLSVDYRRAPEHRYPAAIDDAWNAISWAADQFGQVAVGGDSSGGNLAAAVALRAHDYGLALALQMLVYPVLDGDLDAQYREDFAKRNSGPADPEALGVDWRDNLRYIWQEYAPEPAQRLAPEASPMHAPSLAGLAPALLITAGRDILRAESEQYARRLAECRRPGPPAQLPACQPRFLPPAGRRPRCAGRRRLVRRSRAARVQPGPGGRTRQPATEGRDRDGRHPPSYDSVMREVRLKDVAALAGVSTATVSRVLHSNGYVSAHARGRVEEALRDERLPAQCRRPGTATPEDHHHRPHLARRALAPLRRRDRHRSRAGRRRAWIQRAPLQRAWQCRPGTGMRRDAAQAACRRHHLHHGDAGRQRRPSPSTPVSAR